MFFKKQITWIKLFESLTAVNNQIAPGQVMTMIVGKKTVCIAHTSEGFFAVNDRCPHAGASLGNGYCTIEGTVVCPVHRYQFDLKTGRAKSGIGEYVQTYPVEVRDDGIYIGFEKRVWDLF